MIASRRDSHFGLRRESALVCALTEADASGDWHPNELWVEENATGLPK
jgi:hypothetical protein